MFLSNLLVNTGDNPDRPDWDASRRWLRNVYRVHQRLCMAFPQDGRKHEDPEMVQPFRPDDFGAGQVHVQRHPSAGFLFRIDPQPGGPVVILVLSAARPDWTYAFGLKPGRLDPRTGRPVGNAGYLLAAPPSDPRPADLSFPAGQKLRFRLLANPTRKVHELPPGSRRQEPLTRNGRRVPVACTDEALRAWLDARAATNGFSVHDSQNSPLAVRPGFVYFNKTHGPAGGQKLRSARYDGVLEVTDPPAFAAALAAGIGPAKAFGFGLLSVKPLREA